MAIITTILLAAVVSLGTSGASVLDRTSTYPEKGTDLVFAFMVHRHGDRTPDKANILATLNMDNEEVHALIDQWGYGQLTEVGKRTAYRTGEFIRRRYDSLIAPKYNDSEIYIRSTDVTRTKMTVLTAMAAVFPPVGDTWSQDINWVPVPYTTVPASEDYILSPISSCVNVINKLLSVKMSSGSTAIFEYKYEDVLLKLAHILDREDIMTPYEVLMAWTDLSSLVSMKYDIGQELSELYPELFDAFDSSWDFMFGDEDMVTVGAGALLNEFFMQADKVISGEDTQSVRVYSAHDLNVYSFQAATRVTPAGRPKYGSLYSLELRRIHATGQYFVLPVYIADPNEGKVAYPHVIGCGDILCDYELFKNITSIHRRDELTLKELCSS